MTRWSLCNVAVTNAYLLVVKRRALKTVNVDHVGRTVYFVGLWLFGCTNASGDAVLEHLVQRMREGMHRRTGFRETDVNFIRRTKNPTELEHSRYLHLYNVYNRSLPS